MEFRVRASSGPMQSASAAILSAVTVLGFWKYHVQDAHAELARRQMRLADLRTDGAKAGAASARLHDLRRVVRDLELRFETLKTGLDGGTGTADFIIDIETLAAGSNLEVRRITPLSPNVGPITVEIPYTLHVRGSYHDIAAFFGAIGARQPPVAVRDVTIAAVQSHDEGTLTAECVLSTLHLKEKYSSSASTLEESTPRVVRDGGMNVRGARDPFGRPPRTTAAVQVPFDRPPGVRGVRIDEVSLTGILKDASGFLAMLQAPDKRTFIVRAGETLLDGSVQIVASETVTFSRAAGEPPSGGPRDVVKRLRPGRRDR